MAGRDVLEGQLTQVIQHHMSQPGTEAQVSVHQVQSPSGSGTKRHQIIIDIKQDIDMDEMSTRSLAESVMETLGARSAAVYIDNSQHHIGETNDLESLTTVNVIVANDLSQTVPSPQVIEEDTTPEPAERDGILPGNRIAVDRIVEMANAANTTSEASTTNTVSITTVATTTASEDKIEM
ncbi:hypothetical protein MSG28_015056 [Choristoneura fumiferana]|uniref:Uncharacterized protein n=1 Tax=Choristoneura fumiferana TaxID=7141 RepID=A0ACC0KZ18_CHOFU|nr:hypothetical protein MSG28_015056 [Choristoneura fumiferana]